MKAFVAHAACATTIESADVPVPRIDDDELLVRIHAVGVGIHDSYFLPPEARYPFVVGIEAAGVVEKVGARVSDYRVADRITFVSAMQLKGGTWAEYAAVKTSALIVPIPDGMTFVQAAVIPVAGNTALRTLDAVSDEAVGGSLLIAGGSGAIDTLSIQLARRRGWQVAASASKAHHDYMLALGADLAVDYHDAHWPGQVRQWAAGGVDAAIGINPGTAIDSMAVVRDGGAVIAVSGDHVEPERDIQIRQVPHDADVRDELEQLLVGIASGQLHAEIEHVYPFAEAPSALAKTQTRHARGKLVLQLLE